MRLRYWLEMIGWLLVTALAFGQTNQQPAGPQSTAAQPTNAPPASSQTANQPAVNPQPANPQPVNPRPVKPSAVAAAASASKLARESAPATKVIRNHDLSDGSNAPDADKSEPKPSDAAVQAARDKAIQEDDRKVKQFEAQGKTFQNQVKVQKGKIIDLANRVQSLNDQFDAWSVSHRHVNPAVCWSSQHDTDIYKSWCDIGRNLKDATDESQRQLAQEKVRLEQMQEDIRRKGYGNAVYDPD